MLDKSIIWLDQVRLKDRPLVGGKAAVLGTLRQAGLPIPNGFCILPRIEPTEGFDLWPQIVSAYYCLTPDECTVAVRSSGVAEDSAQASFAGQYETILNVRGGNALRSAIEQCWQSLYSPQARAYQTRRGQGDQLLPVLIQQQIPATVSGVMFTADPISGDNGEILIEAGQGLGEALVSGHVAPTQYRVDRQGQIWSLGSEELLTPSHCRKLAELATQIERILGLGQDIEWALAGNEIYILQARPITPGAAPLPLSHLWTRANIGEVLPQVITPLTWAVFRATLLNRPALFWEIPTDDNQVGEGIRRIYGRGYIRVDGLLNSFCYLPTVTPQVMSRVLGVNLPVASVYARPAGLPVSLAQGAFVLDVLNLLPRLKWLVRQLPHPPEADSEKITELIAWTARCFRLHLKVTAYAIGAFGLLAHLLQRWLPAEAEVLLPEILLGGEDLQTAAQGRSLWQLAEQIRNNTALVALLNSDLDWSGLKEKVSDVIGGPEFLNTFQVFLAKNGARAAGEFELVIPRWRENPAFVLEVLRKFLHTQPAPRASDFAVQHRRQQQVLQQLKLSLTPIRWRLFNRLLASYSAYTTERENIKYQLMEGFARLRQTFLIIGADLKMCGLLENIADIFFLTPAEIFVLKAGTATALPTTDLISQRREQHTRWEARTAPELIMGEGQEVGYAQNDELVGIGCSPGTVEGTARVLFDLAETDLLKPGEILVTPHTDPGWTPLFLSCKGLVTEIGGFLSHGATVAREYGIPAVVNVTGATREIRSGDLIRVDGANGRVIICDRVR